MQADPAPRVVATDAAVAEIERLRAEHGPLMFFLSGGCCDGSSPMCFPDGELLLGPNDLLLGEVDGCSFHIDAEQYERWNRPSFVLDVAPGAGSGMSLEETHAVHFVLRAQPTEAPATATIKVLGGPDCANGRWLTALTERALVELGRPERVEQVTDYAEVVAYGVLSPPAIVVNGQVLMAGRIPALPSLKVALAGRLTAA
jgi:uncharacterized protein (DUF779 family)